jgi:hypothetical protein
MDVSAQSVEFRTIAGAAVLQGAVAGPASGLARSRKLQSASKSIRALPVSISEKVATIL